MTVPLVKIKPVTKIKILVEEGLDYLGFAKNKLALLTANRERLKLPVLKSPVYCIDEIWIKIVSSVWGDEILIGGEPDIRGFLFHPRSGAIEWKTYAYYYGEGQRVAKIPYVAGTGWNPGGKVLPGEPVEYPLIDDDHGTRNISCLSDKWIYRKDPPENYGNIDWKGKNTAKEGSLSNAPVLTWKGPSSRYFAEQMESPQTGINYYSPFVYRGGQVAATLPVSEKLSYGTAQEVPYFVMGAALTTDSDGNVWKVVVAKEYYVDPENGGTRNGIRIIAQENRSTSKKWYHKDDEPGGWHILYTGGGFAGCSPFFFNASGTEASSVHAWVIYTVNVNINNLSATIKTVDKFYNVTGSGNTTGTGLVSGPYNGYSGAIYAPHNGELVDPTLGIWLTFDNNFVGNDRYYLGAAGTRDEKVEAVCAIDYIGDTKIEAKLKSSSHSMRDSIGSLTDEWATTTTLPGSNLATRGSYHYRTFGGIQSTFECKITLSFGGVTEEIYSESMTKEVGTRSAADQVYVEWSGNSPSVSSGSGYTGVGYNDEARDITAGVILFLDLRNDIAVIATRRIDSKSVNHSGGSTFVYNGDGTSTSTQSVDVSSTTVECDNKINVVGKAKAVLPWYDEFVFTDDNDNLVLMYPAWAANSEGTYDYRVDTIHFRYSNETIGSWAVDSDKNHFYSMIQKDGSYTYLASNGGITENVVELTNTEGPNPAFYPIAPV